MDSASAEFWYSTSSVGSGGGGSTGSGQCNTNNADKYTVDCAGTSWIRYEYVGGDNHVGTQIYFSPPLTTATDSRKIVYSTSNEGKRRRVISGDCAEEGNGFWHFGANSMGTASGGVYASNRFLGDEQWVVGAKRYYQVEGKTYERDFTYSVEPGSWGHWATLPFSYYTGGDHGVKYNSNLASLGHVIYDEQTGDPLYKAVEVSVNPVGNSDAAVSRAWEEQCKSSGTNCDPNLNNNSSVYAFCSSASNDTPTRKTFTLQYILETKIIDCDGNERGSDSIVIENQAFTEGDDGVIHVSTKDFFDGHLGEWAFAGVNGAPQGVVFSPTGDTDLHIDPSLVSSSSLPTQIIFTKTEGPENCDPEPDPDPDPDPTDPDDCSGWAPQEYTDSNAEEAWSKVLIAVRNTTLPEAKASSQWHHNADKNGNGNGAIQTGPIYAKPTDEIEWKYCYYPGVERIRETIAEDALEDAECDSSSNTSGSSSIPENSEIISGYTVLNHNLKPDTLNKTKTEYATPGSPEILSGWLPIPEFPYPVKQDPQLSLELDIPFSQINLDAGAGGTLPPLHGEITTVTEDQGNTTTHVKREAREADPADQEDCDDEEACENCPEVNYLVEDQEDKDEADVIVPYNYINTATVKIAYNDDEEEDIAHPRQPLYVGETFTISDKVARDPDTKEEKTAPNGLQQEYETHVRVGIRHNEETDGDYSTQVPNAKLRLIGYIARNDDTDLAAQEGVVPGGEGTEEICTYLKGGQSPHTVKDPLPIREDEVDTEHPEQSYRCAELSNDDQDPLNAKGNYNGFDYDSTGVGASSALSWPGSSYNIPDEAAGNYFCVVAAVYPYTVKNDTDVDPEGSDNWYISQPSCRILAKRPTFQVWGSVLTAGGIMNDEALTKKTNLKGYNKTYPWVASTNKTAIFGAWSELSTTLGLTTKWFASGASLGYRGLTDLSALTNPNPLAYFSSSTGDSPIGVGNPGGYESTSSIGDNTLLCRSSPLTIGNIACNIGGADTEATRNNTLSDSSALRARLESEASNPNSNIIKQDFIEIPPTTVPRGQTYVSLGVTKITGDIIAMNETYSDFSEVPKYVIFADGDLNVDCAVSRIDALIFVGGTFNTCYNPEPHTSDDDDNRKDKDEDDQPSTEYEKRNSASRSNQLIINGAVIANQFILNRSYGANTGRNTIVPGEIFNYDTTLFYWANHMASGAMSGQLTETASRELAPRY